MGNWTARLAIRWSDIDGKSTVVQVMGWCRQAPCHYLRQRWISSVSPYGVTRLRLTYWLEGISKAVVEILFSKSDFSERESFNFKIVAPTFFVNVHWLYASVDSGYGWVPDTGQAIIRISDGKILPRHMASPQQWVSLCDISYGMWSWGDELKLRSHRSLVTSSTLQFRKNSIAHCQRW